MRMSIATASLAALFFALALTVAASPQLAAQQPVPPAAAPAPTATPTTDRVPVPAPTATALSYYRTGNVLWVAETIWILAVPALILLTGVSARLRTSARRVGRRWLLAAILYIAAYLLLDYSLNLPVAFYRDFVREHAYGLSNQTLAKWARDAATNLAVTIVFGALVLPIPYLLLRRSPRRWWLYSGLAALPVLVFVVFVTPIWVEPLFNRFGPMKNKVLETSILALAERSGIEGARVYEVDKSVDTKTLNAYVTGVGSTKRIVLWDTIIKKLPPEELLFVMGHEMGHYVLHHVLYIVLGLAALVMLSLYVVHRTAHWLIGRFRDRFGFDELSDIASLPLLLLLLQATLLAAAPVYLALSRHLEHEADRFGLELTQNSRAAALAFVKLQEEDLAVPRPGLLFVLWRAGHPALGERIDFANDYRPWERGEALRYGELFIGGHHRR